MKPVFSRRLGKKLEIPPESKECPPEEKVYQLLQGNPRGMTVDQIRDQLPGLGIEEVFTKKILEDLRLAHRVLRLSGDVWIAAKS